MIAPTPRYLTSFHLKRAPHFFTDVLIIGGGLAGLRAANAVDTRLSALVVTKDALSQSNSNYAQGGIAGVLDPSDTFDDHIADTLAAGGSLCDRSVVETVVREAPRRIEELMQWGARFDEQAGELLLGREGGHSRRRVVHALGDATGKEVMRAVIERTQRLPHVEIWENAFTVDLLTEDGQCVGALIAKNHDKFLVWAKQTILCTGGAGQIYRETTNPGIATGDGHALAFRAGAELRDMEFFQFHPTVLYIAGGARSLITEAVRGEGAHLIDKDGLRFMSQYDSREELAPRDVVSQAIVSQMEKTRHPSVYLDMSHLDREFVLGRFPGIAAACAKFGLDLASDPIPVRPGAHYMIGGVTVGMEGRTTVPRLWAAGEVTSSGLHGANRLASNSLLEGLVFGAHVGEAASAAALDMPDRFLAPRLENPAAPPPATPLDIADIRNSLKSLTWRNAGVRRDRQRLEDGLRTIENWSGYALAPHLSDVRGWELQNMLVVANLVLCGALQREESRGVHWRQDFPQTDDENWRRHVCFRRGVSAL